MDRRRSRSTSARPSSASRSRSSCSTRAGPCSPPCSAVRSSLPRTSRSGSPSRSTPTRRRRRSATRTGSATTILVGTDVNGEPTVLDLSVSGRLLPADRLDKAAKAIRRILLDTFLAPPDDLRGAAGPLTKLAVWGATLRNQLKTGARRVPRRRPVDPRRLVRRRADPVRADLHAQDARQRRRGPGVRHRAAAGATECVAGCPDRTRSDVRLPVRVLGDEQGGRAACARRQPDPCDGCRAAQDRRGLRCGRRHLEQGRRAGQHVEPAHRDVESRPRCRRTGSGA